MKAFVVVLVILLLALHHDYWNWKTHEPMIFGFVPIGLAWHVGISTAAGIVWFLAVRFCWPADVDEIDEVVNTPPHGRGGHA